MPVKYLEPGELVKFAFPDVDSGTQGGDYFCCLRKNKPYTIFRNDWENVPGLFLEHCSSYGGFNNIQSALVLFDNTIVQARLSMLEPFEDEENVE